MSQMYVYKVSPEYTVVHYYTGTDVVCMEEWSGRSLEEFRQGMERKGGFKYHCEEYTLSGDRTITEHCWTK